MAAVTPRAGVRVNGVSSHADAGVCRWLRRRVREPGDSGAAGGSARPDLAAGRVGSWALRGKAGSDRPGKPLVLVFMVGGASHAEVRSWSGP